MAVKHVFPADGDYSFKVKGVTGYFQRVLGSIKGEQLEVTIDGERVKLFDWDKEIQNTTGNGRSTPRIPVKAGLQMLGIGSDRVRLPLTPAEGPTRQRLEAALRALGAMP